MARALVTGSTSGLGLEFAWQLAGTGHDLVLVGRDEERLELVARQIRHVHDVDIETLAADVAVRRELDRVATRLTDPVEPVDLLVSDAEYALRGTFLEIPVADHERQSDTLMRSTLVLCHAAAGAMAQRRRGAILTVSSPADHCAGGAQAASRSWITVFTETLAAELEGSGVTATVVLPGAVDIEEGDPTAVSIDGRPRVTWLKAPFVVQQALRDAAHGLAVSAPTPRFRPSGEPRPRDGRTLLPSVLPAPLWRRLEDRRLAMARRRASRRRLRAPWLREDC